MYLARLYDLFMKHDCTMIEINPLAEGTDGQGKTQWSGGGRKTVVRGVRHSGHVRHSGQGWVGVGVRHSGQW